MSTPTMNHSNHMQQQQQEQQQQQQINENQHTHSNSANSPHASLTRSDSTSTVILEEEDEIRTCRRNGPTTLPATSLAKLSAQLHSLLKTSGLFNKDLETSDKLNEFFASENGFALQRLLSEVNVNDNINIDINELLKTDSTKLLDARTLSEFLRSESFDQLMASIVNTSDQPANPSAISCSTSSFSELRSVSPELITNNMYHNQTNSQLKTESDNNPLMYNQMDSFDLSTPATVSPAFNYNQGTLNAIEHDHAFLTKRMPLSDTPTTSKRTSGRGIRRTSSRIQSRAVASTVNETTDTNSKNSRNVNRAKDIKTSDDLSYYLERRRKNNEASKVSRAARKQKFGDMDEKCQEYERVNTELQTKIKTLEKVTTTLKNGLVNNFQRKN